MKRLKDLLENKEDHYLYPFFWQKGQDNETIGIYLDQMNAQGIYDACIESRPHPEFLEEGWWKTMDFIVAEAEKRGMHLWILDDAQFPTGYANGKVPDELKKRYIECHRFDIVGTGERIEMNFNMLAGFRNMRDPLRKKDRLLYAVLAENDHEVIDEITVQDVTDKVSNNILSVELERKHYSIFAIYETRCTNDKATQEYLDPLRSEATQILLNEVYEKHYAHYSEHFGKTITAFFSDEPRFGNSNSRVEVIGKNANTLPINEDVITMMAQRGVKVEEMAFLFAGTSSRAKEVRFTYMDIVTSLYRDNFARYIGKWCEEHGVAYVGHVIEDDNTHARLGQGPGHYFRAMSGEHVAGIDIIGGQVVPGMDYHHDAFSRGGSDGEFYHYALCAMARSAAKHDPKKNGTVMCEAYGAYGWVEGLKTMKWITDHMISHGVNLIVPHAFDPAPFPDWDCPPHFYAHGNNPQYQYFGSYTKYTNRLCHLFSGGHMATRVGVLYHAFAEWNGDTMMDQKVCKQLTINQIPFDIVSEDLVLENKGTELIINGYGYDVLIVPECTDLPNELINALNGLSTRVVYVNTTPAGVEGTTVALDEIGTMFSDHQCVKLAHHEEKLTVYPYEGEDGKAFMFFNEDMNHVMDVDVTLDTNDYQLYDAIENKTSQLAFSGNTFHLHLAPYETLIIVSGKSSDTRYVPGKTVMTIEKVDNITMKPYNADVFTLPQSVIGYMPDQYQDFSGTVTYTLDLDMERTDLFMVLDKVYETVEVKVNGQSTGVRMAPGYVFDLEDHLVKGRNHIEIITVNTLSRNLRDMFSVYLPLEPFGLTGPIRLTEKDRS